MHELGITRSIVGIACENADNKKVKRVTMRMGIHSGMSKEAVLFCFDVVAKGTLCEEAVLDIEVIEGRARCRACGMDFALPTLTTKCACGKRDFDIVAGEEMKIHQIETTG